MPVIDASVAIKWFVDEPDSSAAYQLLESHGSGEAPLAAPDLIVYEVSNVLLHNPRFSASDVQHCIQRLYALELELIAPSAELVTATIALASARRLTFYDALYVRLALHLSLPFYSADRKLIFKIHDLPRMKLLQ